MMGFAGQLSLGHAIYVGLGAYVAALLFTRYGIAPWLGLLAAIPVDGRLRRHHRLSRLPLRRRRRLFRHPHHRLRRVRPHRLRSSRLVNASAGLFLPVAQYAHNDLWRLRGDPAMFYYVILAATVLAFILCRVLLTSRIGYFWLAIREDEIAARPAGIDTFRYKMYAVMISAAVTAFAGVFYAFFYNNLFPEQVFNISRSIEIILGPIIGGIGTLFGPILGAFILTGLAEALNAVDAAFRFRSARRQAGVLRHLPARRRAGAAQWRVAVAGAPPWHCGGSAMTALLSVQSVSKRFRGLLAVDGVSFDVPEGAIFAVIGPNGAGKTTLFNMIAGAMPPTAGCDQICRRAHRRHDGGRGVPPRARPHVSTGAAVSRARASRTMSLSAHCGSAAMWPRPAIAAQAVLRRLDLFDKRHQLASTLTLPDRKRLEVARALATGPQASPARRSDGGSAADRDRPHGGDAQALNRESGLTILLIEHVMRAVMALASRVSGARSRQRHRRRRAGERRARSRGGAILSRPVAARSRSGVMLRVEGLDLYYGDAQALDDVSLEIGQGAIVAIVGANGAGKTTLIRTIAGMQRPARGRILYRDTDITGWPSHRVCDLGIGQVAEGRQVFPTLSVERESRYGRDAAARARSAREEPRTGVRDFPAARRAGAPVGRHLVGRRAADARHRPLSDGRAGTDHVRRAVARPRAGRRAQRARGDRRDSIATASRAFWSSRTSRCRSSSQAALMCWKTAASRSPAAARNCLCDDRVRSAYLGL